MQVLVVANNPANWPLDIEGVTVVGARQYLTDPKFSAMKNARVFNVCRSYGYQSLGYYVSLLAEARGHKPTPDVVTIQDMKSASLVRAITDDVDSLIQKTLRKVPHDEFTLSIYFGRTLAQRDRALGKRLFGLLRTPMMRAQFRRAKGEWELTGVRPISMGEIPDAHLLDVVLSAQGFFRRAEWSGTRKRAPRYHMAVLVDGNEPQAPSDAGAIQKFIRAAEKLGVGAETIDRDDFERLAEFDMLLIRATTSMNHFTYRFSRRAVAEGMAVIDDPISISRCSNKVYLAERLSAAGVPIPQTVLMHRDNLGEVLATLGLPVVLKQPDSAFSMGVTKAHTEPEFHEKAGQLLKDSELVIAQRYLPTEFDWRIGVLDGKAFYACQYFMARNHWQILQHNGDGSARFGKNRTIPVERAPRRVVSSAVRAAKLIGDGLYGVDVKEVNGKPFVIEVNDNPSIDSGVEDQVLKDGMYERIVESLIRRTEEIRNPRGRGRSGAGAGAV